MGSDSFAAHKLAQVRAAAPDHLFTSEQVGRLLAQFTFAKDKLSALRLVVPRLSDFTIEGRDAIVATFTLSSDQEEVRRVLSACQ